MAGKSNRPIALVTGASGGIGADLARELAADGHDLILVARTEQAMQSLAADLKAAHGATSHILSVDLAKPGAAKKVEAGVAALGLDVDVLVNNAGFGDTGPFAEVDPAKITAMTQLNIGTLTDLARVYLPGMIKRGRGRLLNVASTAAFQPGPNWAVYCASKAYVLSLTEAIAQELKGTGVTATALCPGPTKTGFATAASAGSSAIFDKNPTVMTSEDVAKQGYRALKSGRAVIVTGFANKASAFAGRFLPRALTLRVGQALLGAGH